MSEQDANRDLLESVVAQFGPFSEQTRALESLLTEVDRLRTQRDAWQDCARTYHRGGMGMGDDLYRKALNA